MEIEKCQAIRKKMMLVIPGMVCAIIGDYCMGIEPADSYTVSGMISSGFLTISDWRIAVSNIGGMIGAVFYAVAALAFLEFLQSRRVALKNKSDRIILSVYMAGLILGCTAFMYFHIACATLIHNYNVIYDAAGGNTELAVEMWNRSYRVQFVTYWGTFIAFGISATGGWIALILKGILPLKKVWLLAAPLMVAGIGFLLEALIPFPFNGFASGFESFGWIVMFLGGIRCVKQSEGIAR
ncbi:MAG: hypothetical protein NC302_12490 [Bacteroidales bacterium]|nr:hypothetical protein [Bacteroidales bacterium]MCM1416916.1 hypothetical protein [bacterium]MCM1424723.1 hypothetical protein [bacterium]